MVEKYIISDKLVLCEDKFDTRILYDLNEDESFKVTKETVDFLKYLQLSRSKEEIENYLSENKISKTSFENFKERGLLVYSKSDNQSENIFDTSKIKMLSLEEKPKFPSKIGFYLTNACIFNCIHCVFSSGKPRPIELSDEDWMKILNDAIDNKIEILQISGGEPLLRKNLLKRIIERARENFEFIGINTNGILIDEEFANILKGENIIVYLSCYGNSNELYEEVTGKPIFDQFQKSLRILLKHGVNVGASIPLINPLIKNLSYIESYLHSEGIDVISYIGLIPRGRGEQNFDKLICPWSPDYIELLQKYTKKSEEMLVLERVKKTKDPSKEILIKQRGTSKISGKIIDIPCHLMDKRMFVFPDGSVYPCEFLPINIGNLKNEKIKDILKKNETKYFMEQLTADDIYFCKDCAYKFTCKAICPSYSYSFTGDYKNPPTTCIRALKHFFKGQYNKPLV